MNVFEVAGVYPVASGLSEFDLFLLDCLLDLKRNLAAGELPLSGICAAVYAIAKLKPVDERPYMWHTVNRVVQERAITWQHHSGVSEYPVPGVIGQDPVDLYIAATAQQKWSKDNLYGTLRLDLLDFLIADLRGEVPNERN